MATDFSKIEAILKSRLFTKILEQAATLLTKNKKVSKLAISAIKKLAETGDVKTFGKGVIEQIRLLANMIYYYGLGKYRNVGKRSIVTVVAVMLYFVLPIDLIPDLIPGMGYIDDITLIGWLFSTLGSEIGDFKIWFKKYQKAESIQYLDID